MHAFLCLSLIACGGEVTESDTTTGNTTDTGANDESRTIDLADEDLPLVVHAPQGEDEPTVIWKEEFGHVEVVLGERFGLTIAEIPGDLERKKSDLERDLLQTHEILSEENGTLIYKSTFPDSEDLVFYHFHQVLDVDGRTFVVEDLASGQFKESDVRTMAEAVKQAPAS